MAFWGTEVKPGRPFTHAPLNGNGRLHLSGATLGIGIATQKSIVQCNVGNKRPVFVCCLFPGKAEFCTLNLEFEESDEVVFSVIGPRTVHLTGYYLSSSSLNDESESYGEDIGESDTERSENSQESEYGGSFINDDDDDLLVLSSSPESNEEMVNFKKSKDGTGRRRRLRKKYQLSKLENDDSSQQKNFTRAVAAAIVLDSETEDTLSISSLSRAKHASDSGKADVEEKATKQTADHNENEAEDNATMLDWTNAAIGAQPDCESGVRNEEKANRNKGNLNNNEAEDDATILDRTNAATGAQPECESGLRNEEKGNLNNNEAEDDATTFDGTNVSIGAQPKRELGDMYEEKPKMEKGNLSNDEAEDNASLSDGTTAAIGGQPESESGIRNEEKAEEKGSQNNNEAEDDATMLEGTNATIGAQPECESGLRNEEKGSLSNNEAEDDATTLERTNAAIGAQPEWECRHNDLLLAASQACVEDGAKLKRKRKKHIKEKTLNDNVSNEDECWKSGSNLDSVTQDVRENGTQKQVNDKKRKKKKRCKSKEDGDAMKLEPPVLSANQKDGSAVEMEGKNANDNATQLSNGIIIEELEMGKPDGKVASIGKKVRVHYIGKLKESGQVFDSNAGKPLSKFRLGEEKVPELWNVGLNGMRVGGKRRLTVPPSVSYRNEGASENIPSNSWLVFDVELVKVR